MSELSYLEKLLDGVEVEWKTLEDITLRTSNIKWREVIRSYRYIDLTSVDIATKKITETTEITKNNAPSRAQKLVDENDVIFATTRPTQQRFCLIDSEYAGEVASTGYCILRAKQDQVLPKWILHWISTSDFKKHVEENQSGSAYPAISDSKVKECLIPIPCPDNPEKSLAIQSEIVRILDKFTALTAELNMRKKQYNYYRDQLLSFKEGEVEWKTLEEVLVDKFWIMPATPKFDDNGEIPYITSKNISGGNIDFERVKHISRDDFLSISKNRPILKGDFLISMIGTIGEIARVKCLDPDFYGQNMYLIRLNEELLHPRYFLHFFDSPRMKFYFKSVKNNSGQGYLKANNIDGLSIPLPSIDEQQKIAFILDKFDTLTNSITEGLPREIELRQKQYEYYRDLLFSFPKPETVSN